MTQSRLPLRVAVGDGQRLPDSLAGQPVPSQVPFWRIFGTSVTLVPSPQPSNAGAPGFAHYLRTAESLTFTVEDSEVRCLPVLH
jgi:hypothetical protein